MGLAYPCSGQVRVEAAYALGRLAEAVEATETPQNPLLSRGFAWSGRRDSNPRPSPWQGMPTCSADLHKRPETVSALQFWLIAGSRRFALFRDVSRPVRGLSKSGCVTPVAAGSGQPTQLG